MVTINDGSIEGNLGRRIDLEERTVVNEKSDETFDYSQHSSKAHPRLYLARRLKYTTIVHGHTGMG